MALVLLKELPINIKYGDIDHYKIGNTEIRATKVFDRSNLHPKQDHCLNARSNLATIEEAVCYMAIPYDPDQDGYQLAFNSAPYNETVMVQASKPSSAVVPGAISAVLLFLVILAVAAWLYLWRQKRKQKQMEMDMPTQKVTQAESGPLLDSKNRPLTLRALVTKVEEERFNVAAEYKKLNELDQRFVAGNQSKVEAIRWNDKSNRYGNTVGITTNSNSISCNN